MISCSGCRENCLKSRGSARTASNLQQCQNKKRERKKRKWLPKHWTSTCLKINRSKKRTRMRMRAVTTRMILRRQTTPWQISKTAQAQRRQTTSNLSVASCVVVKSSNQTLHMVVRTYHPRPSSLLSSNKSNNKVLWVPAREEGLRWLIHRHRNLLKIVIQKFFPAQIVSLWLHHDSSI